jgi:4-aminobutyrate aminotransferase
MKAHTAIGDVRGLGLMLGIEIVRDRSTKERDPQLRDAIIEQCFRRGLLLLGAGPSTIRVSPPLMIDKEQAECAANIINDAIAAATA